MDQTIRARFDLWRRAATADPDLIAELNSLAERGDERAVTDAFYRDLAFGTAGLRGVIGAGTNRMNFYTVARTSQGLADYILRHYPDRLRIAVSYDSRIKSELFARVSCAVFAANGIEAWLYDRLMPTPCLSYAVRALGCAAGVMITASHNPAQYNGYKVYGEDGCQMTEAAADEVLAAIEATDLFEGVRRGSFDELLAAGRIRYIPESVYDGFIAEVKAQSMLSPSDPADRSGAIVYSPLCGTGLRPVLRALTESGFAHIRVVSEQEAPDGRFPTCPYPNPEIREAMALGLEYAERERADLLLATDPDCDRVGIAVRDGEGKMTLLTGNETGMLLLDYICSRRAATGRMPADAVLVKTVVTVDMADRIAAHYGVRTVNVLTGFKYIGEQIALLEAKGRADSYIFGFEESYGYLSGTYVRDKDAVNASLLICEMFAYYRAQGVGLWQKLEELYAAYGYTQNSCISYAFEGAEGFAAMRNIMDGLRAPIASFGGRPVEKKEDFGAGLYGLPKSDVIKFYLSGHCSLVARPSGTEPKLKIYISVNAPDRAAAAAETEKIRRDIESRLRP